MGIPPLGEIDRLIAIRQREVRASEVRELELNIGQSYTVNMMDDLER